MPFLARRALSAVAAVALIVAGSGCQRSTSPEPTPEPTVLNGTASATPSAPASAKPSASASSSAPAHPKITPSTSLDDVTVAGEFGKTPTVTVKTPWAIDATKNKVISAGDGPTVAADSYVEINYQGVNGYTGKVFDESFSGGQSVAFPLSGVISGFAKGLTGQKAGSRVLMAITGPDGYDSQGGAPSAGIEVGDTLIFVVDIISTTLPGPTGAAVTPPAGLPTVAETDGKPVVTIPQGATPPAALVVQPLTAGTGRPITATDAVQVNYAEYAWGTGKLVKQTYGYKPLMGSLDSTIPGWQKALVGKKVGSRVLIVAPPSAGYPSGNPRIGVSNGETMVYVVDILFAQAGGN